MSSIRRIQTERALESVVYQLYSQGRAPLFSEVAERLAKRLSKYPAGSPLPLPLTDAIANGQSDVDQYNEFLTFTELNLDVLYEAALSQVEDVLDLTSALQFHLDRLKGLRRRVETSIDDHLLAQNNTDGYFFALSDVFTDLSLTDLSLTSAHIDTTVGAVVLPTVSSLTTRLEPERIGTPSILVRVGGSPVPQPFNSISPISGAAQDNLDNLAWVFEVETDRPTEVVATVTIPIGVASEPVDLSRVEFTPYGSLPIQLFMETSNGSGYAGFGRKILSSDSKMAFNDTIRPCTSLRLTMRKTQADYVSDDGGRVKYRYLFGARAITIMQQAYEKDATFVSKGLYLPEADLADSNQYVIDGISLYVDDQIPPNTDITYYIAPDQEGDEITDFNWRQVVPINSDQDGEKVLRFDGAEYFSTTIRLNPGNDETQQIPITGTGVVSNRNPSPSIIPGVDVYRIADLDDADDQILLNSLSLIEGLNTTRIYSRPLITAAEFNDLDLGLWAIAANGNLQGVEVDYGRVDSGNGFFYGGDVGVSAREILVETFIDCEKTFNIFTSEFQKVDARSRTWDVRVYHNGDVVGQLPSGVDTLQIPWKFHKGINHIAVMVRIPEEGDITSLYAGSIQLMGDRSLSQYGTVRLANWSYVDFFTMQFNETGQPQTFTIHNGELISRRKPTTNFLLKYAKSAGNGITGLRLRADMSRSVNNANVTPSLSQYRIRFSYGEGA